MNNEISLSVERTYNVDHYICSSRVKNSKRNQLPFFTPVGYKLGLSRGLVHLGKLVQRTEGEVPWAQLDPKSLRCNHEELLKFLLCGGTL